MQEIVDRDEEIIREIWDREAAIAHFRDAGESFKAEHIKTIPANEDISIYRQGNWLDRHGSASAIDRQTRKAFKLLKLAGAYWQATRITRSYSASTALAGEATRTKRLPPSLGGSRKARSSPPRSGDGPVPYSGRGRRQRVLASEGLDDVPRGRALRERLEEADYVGSRRRRIDRTLWERSGHWEKFRENMFTAEDEGDKVLALKPMNCPGHVQVFKQGIKSYRDLPLRMAEFGSCHRNEPSGALHGLMRVRAFTQDDAHIFCMESQIEDETKLFIDLLSSIYRDFGSTISRSSLPTVRKCVPVRMRSGTAPRKR